MYKEPLTHSLLCSEFVELTLNTELNKWYDFGIGRGGNIIALAELLYDSSDVSYLIRQIERNAPCNASTGLPIVKSSPQQNSFENLTVQTLAHPALVKYLLERGISLEIARTVCKELHFDTRGKHYFGIGFPNRAGGYEIRNPFFKGGITPKDISHLYTEKTMQSCFVFEGFIDFLSFLMLHRKEHDILKQLDYLVLNSVTNVQKALEPLSYYEKVQCFLDNDEAGRNAYQTLLTGLKIPVTDASSLYADYKDLNEFICRQNSLQQKLVRSLRRGLKP